MNTTPEMKSSADIAAAADDAQAGETLASKIREIKHQFMVFRNGIVADALRKAGLPHRVIFGLQLPQLNEIAKGCNADAALARALWADLEVRESRLLACRLFPTEELSAEEARTMAKGVRSREEADMLAFRLLRYLPQAAALSSQLLKGESPLERYAGEALLRNLE